MCTICTTATPSLDWRLFWRERMLRLTTIICWMKSLWYLSLLYMNTRIEVCFENYLKRYFTSWVAISGNKLYLLIYWYVHVRAFQLVFTCDQISTIVFTFKMLIIEVCFKNNLMQIFNSLTIRYIANRLLILYM